jgi:putative acetyltransferase
MEIKPENKFCIEPESQIDIEGIHQVNIEAFGRVGEASVVDELRNNCETFISLVAKSRDEVIGHILFTAAHVKQPNGDVVEGLGLAPLAVSPDHQGIGVGSALCKAGLDTAERLGFPFVIVLGHPGYYPHFGFEPAGNHGIVCSYPDVPREAFMIKILDTERMSDVSGVVYYRPEFDNVT